MEKTIGFIGLGGMGSAMAENLLKAGYRLRVYNRSPDKAKPLVAQGAIKAAQPDEVLEPGGILISSLADDRAVEESIGNNEKLLRRLGPDGIHVSTSTIAPATSRRLAQGHQQYGVAYLASPVLGRPDAAAAGKLGIFLSGPAPAKERVQPILRVLGQALFDFGAEPGSANVVKLAFNFMLAATIESFAEAFTLAEKNGIARNMVADVLAQTLLATPALKNYAKLIAEERYEPALFKLALGFKDLNLVLQTAVESKTPMPLASLAHTRLMTGVARGHGNLDWTGMAKSVSEDAGLH